MNALIKKSRKLISLIILIVLFSGCENSSDSTREKTDDEPNPVEEKDDVFTIAVLPDTQYYTSEKHGGTMELFERQIDWILSNYEDANIQYVVHLGDLVEHGEKEMIEWERAKDVMYKLEEPLSNFPDGLPYGISVGNHDQEPYGNANIDGTDRGYNKFFGKDHFEGKNYYGGSYGEDNDNHYSLFSYKDKKFIVMFLEYNEPGNENYDADLEQKIFQWGKGVLEDYSDHRAIIVSHSLLARPQGSSMTVGGMGDNSIQSEFTNQGERIYEEFKSSKNVFMMLCGHRSGEGLRVDTFNGNTIKSLLSDYQSRENEAGEREGGSALMRTLELNLTKNTLKVETFKPSSTGVIIREMDGDSYFTLPLFE